MPDRFSQRLQLALDQLIACELAMAWSKQASKLVWFAYRPIVIIIIIIVVVVVV